MFRKMTRPLSGSRSCNDLILLHLELHMLNDTILKPYNETTLKCKYQLKQIPTCREKMPHWFSNVPFLYPLKTSENQRFSDVFRGYRNRTLDWIGLINNLFTVKHSWWGSNPQTHKKELTVIKPWTISSETLFISTTEYYNF